MSIVHTLDGCSVGVQEAKGVEASDPQGEPKVVGRSLVITHPQSDQIWLLNFDLRNANDIGGQLQGQPPKKHIDVVGAGAMPPGQVNGHR